MIPADTVKSDVNCKVSSVSIWSKTTVISMILSLIEEGVLEQIWLAWSVAALENYFNTISPSAIKIKALFVHAPDNKSLNVILTFEWVPKTNFFVTIVY